MTSETASAEDIHAAETSDTSEAADGGPKAEASPTEDIHVDACERNTDGADAEERIHPSDADRHARTSEPAAEDVHADPAQTDRSITGNAHGAVTSRKGKR
jgi:hypothetical protein